MLLLALLLFVIIIIIINIIIMLFLALSSVEICQLEYYLFAVMDLAYQVVVVSCAV